MINFYHQCGQPMSVKPEFAGRQGNCPRCQQPFVVPNQSNTTPPPAQPPTQAQPTAQRQTARQPPAPTGATQAMHTGSLRPPGHAPPVNGGAGPRLEVVHGPAGFQGKTIPLQPGRACVMGRDPGADLTIPSERVSRRHCQLQPSQDGVYVLEDLGSANGTLVNQVRIQGRKVLMGGEYIQIGDCLFRFCE